MHDDPLYVVTTTQKGLVETDPEPMTREDLISYLFELFLVEPYTEVSIDWVERSEK
jgi:hypothetical protein